MIYKVVIKQTEDGFTVWVPGLPGCRSQGASEEDVLENVRKAIQMYHQAITKRIVGEEVRFVEVPDL
jgi:predicted RNase H-like HicB family nuclease